VHLVRIAELLAPFVGGGLSEAQLAQLAAYLEILHRWNARVNLTAVRDPEEVVTRHFGESLFAARALFPSGPGCPQPLTGERLLDIGSGAGFPGLPIKIWAPSLEVALLEAQQKKATFLREVVRALDLKGISVAAVRAEDFSGNDDKRRATVTLRAVEKFDLILPTAARLATPGRVALLIGLAQVPTAYEILPAVEWSEALPIPLSEARILLVGEFR
jgi:16S rRNA (guanine527-N7)-methyltransferase